MLRFPSELEGRPERDLINCAAKQPAHHLIEAVHREFAERFTMPILWYVAIWSCALGMQSLAAPLQSRSEAPAFPSWL
jgi:hypothetical protein